MLKRLNELIDKYNSIEEELSEPDVIKNMEHFKSLNGELKRLKPVVDVAKEYKSLHDSIRENKKFLNDPEFAEIAKEEIKKLQNRLKIVKDELEILLIPKDPMDRKDIILEIRSGTGGEEASLFALDLFRMYMHFAEKCGFSTEILSESLSDTGGIKELIVSIKGDSVYSKFKYESGTHRVQRIPITESQGRIHTSAATVAVLPEAKDVEVEINSDDLRIDVFRSSGHGGQHVNTTDSAVRITHLATNIVVSCQDEKSQYKNKEKAMKILRSKLYELYRLEKEKERADYRKSQVGTGDRSGRIRTYNFPQGRVTDHRINLTLYNLEDVLNGDLDEIVDALAKDEQLKILNKSA